MSSELGSVSDDFYISNRLFLKMEMALERETILHFFDRIRKEFPLMNRFRRREAAYLLEEDPTESLSRRWLRLEQSSLRFGYFAPPSLAAVREMAETIYTTAPYFLTFSDIDYDHMELVYGFDLEYRGNHDQIVAETLWQEHPLGQFLVGEEATHAIDSQPYFGVTLNEACDLQAYIETKSRTSTFEVRTGEYERQPLSVFLTIRKYWNPQTDAGLPEVALSLFQHADRLSTEKVVPLLVNPLAQAIASRL
jgi:hypothetical protein